MKWYYATGNNGSVIQCEDGRFADTVSGDGDFDALENSSDEDENAEWVKEPLLGEFDSYEMAEYVDM